MSAGVPSVGVRVPELLEDPKEVERPRKGQFGPAVVGDETPFETVTVVRKKLQ